MLCFKKKKKPYREKRFLHLNKFSVCMVQALLKSHMDGTSLVAQWQRVHLPMQGTRVQVQEDPTCRGATKPMRHNY